MRRSSSGNDRSGFWKDYNGLRAVGNAGPFSHFGGQGEGSLLRKKFISKRTAVRLNQGPLFALFCTRISGRGPHLTHTGAFYSGLQRVPFRGWVPPTASRGRPPALRASLAARRAPLAPPAARGRHCLPSGRGSLFAVRISRDAARVAWSLYARSVTLSARRRPDPGMRHAVRILRFAARSPGPRHAVRSLRFAASLLCFANFCISRGVLF